MADRLHDLVVGLQRMAESARARSDDLRYIQQRDTDEHLQWLDSLLAMVEKVRGVLIEERQAFMGPPREKPAQLPKDIPGMPRVVAKGPREVAG
jgi:hypothetical protein